MHEQLPTDDAAVLIFAPSFEVLKGDMREIRLGSSGLVAIVDDDDYEALSRFSWHLLNANGWLYAKRSTTVGGRAGKDLNVLMHNAIMPPPPGHIIDHRDGNGLNNQRSNFRFATNAQNVAAGKKARCGFRGGMPTSRFRGVSLQRESGKWYARIVVQGRHLHLGRFDDEITAAAAYDQAARVHFGVFAYQNLVGA